jgi:SagB-type dehydrogenase family enzyme
MEPGEASPKPSDVLVVSPLARVRWVAGRLDISAAGARVRLVTSDVDVMAVLHAFAHARSLREVKADLPAIRADELIAVVSEFRAADVLLPPAAAEEITSRHWDSDSLAFHRRSRAAVWTTGVPPSSPAIPPSRFGKVIELDRRPDAAPRDFRSVLDTRSSRRSWRSAPMPNRELGEFLWLSARNRADGDADVVSRPYPSGGAACSLELYPVLAPRSVVGIPAGVYRYRPEAHALDTVSTRPGHRVPLLTEAAAALGAVGSAPVAIVITSRFERASSSYGELAYSLVLTEVGGLVQTMYLVAEYLGLAACAVGGGPLDGLIGEVIGAPDLIEPVVGELVIGRRAD